MRQSILRGMVTAVFLIAYKTFIDFSWLSNSLRFKNKTKNLKEELISSNYLILKNIAFMNMAIIPTKYIKFSMNKKMFTLMTFL